VLLAGLRLAKIVRVLLNWETKILTSLFVS